MQSKISKRFKKLKDLQVNKKIETIDDAIKKIKINCTSKFNESIDVSFKLNLKQKKTDVGLRTLVNLPHGNGRKIKVAVLCEENKTDEAKTSGNFTQQQTKMKTEAQTYSNSAVYNALKSVAEVKDYRSDFY